ncbi:anhydro-N-acetylmuramic acid kinase [Ursidibacter maritimus]|uniref:Anhydro-N-acetylmuramic acid kinase n=1 Tax=Ursidibacter maritimus TaxID=1331689 RepID=A0A949SZK5_9PAST|nr:anhydro-N-acetylmuramic acid kinase [Ursidibacter maritimus]KAE9539015.1 anhydro-N-acetylmuramic acid kinase [Ursidibacter maritimus]MBV6523755.1 anhydro-N-acetylmuramic acid kinase [Ursidibacter maritimus]MBV6526610.1 anhydro-N-acetylmuramic acid kinase [Ursidibacter maritimus]MBV6527949.1 anhydro-N-acetylmuramic acid kinase [Ursidibacter maritimus]MBV6528888.1 anhydro-N-acetylmuramic acid kinase [Ursidibacter maritimus]
MATAYYIGVMSGTSLDGVDLALMDFAQTPPKLIASDFTSMPEPLRFAIGEIVKKGEVTLQQLGEVDHQLGLLYADCINHFLTKQGLKASQIEAIGCHGQTIWHSPQSPFPFTTQIGDMSLVAVKTGITTVGDFRRKDMAYGGQGAPLVPAFHQAFFADEQRITAVLNIGGISNVSLLVPDQETIGYDIGAGNTLLDLWIETRQGKRFDQNGEWARTGQIDQQLLDILLDEPFFQQPPPKSTGRELFNLQWLQKKLAQYHAILPSISAENVQRTLLEFTAQTIADALQKINNPQHLPCILLICGGGARNVLLMERITALLPHWQVSTTTEYGLDIDYVEAAAFAWLAYQRIHHLPSNLPSVTGATQAVSLGAIFTN